MLWALVGVIAGCKELHHAIDQKTLPFRHDNWAGHILAHVHHTCMKYDDSHQPRGSPFRHKHNNAFLIKMLEQCMPSDMRQYQGSISDNPDLFFRFNVEYWHKLFPTNDYANVSVQPSVEEALSSVKPDETDVIIIVDKTFPQEQACAGAKRGHIAINTVNFEARVILCINASLDEGNRPASFVAKRFARRGGGFNQWQSQVRGTSSLPQLMTICDFSSIWERIPCSSTGFLLLRHGIRKSEEPLG